MLLFRFASCADLVFCGLEFVMDLVLVGFGACWVVWAHVLHGCVDLVC